MTETGKVKSIDGNYAVVSVDKKDECSKCGMCLFPKNTNSVDFRAENTLNASVGDTVVIESKKDGKLAGALLAFFVPLVLIAISAVITYIFLNNEIWMLILSVILISLWYTILAVIDKKLKKSVIFCHVIVSIIDKEKKIDE